MKTSLFWILLGMLLAVQAGGLFREKLTTPRLLVASLVLTVAMTVILFWGKV